MNINVREQNNHKPAKTVIATGSCFIQEFRQIPAHMGNYELSCSYNTGACYIPHVLSSVY